jgi:hypothetical protein
LLGKSPDAVYWKRVRDYVEDSPFAKQYARIHDLARRAQECGHLKLRNAPPDFIEWAKLNGIDFSAALEEAILGSSHLPNLCDLEMKHPHQQSGEQETALSGKGRQTALKLIIGMAIGGYGYDPKKSRSSVVPEIVDDLLKQGIHLTDETVRHWLHEGAKLLAVEQEKTKDR